MARQNSLQTPLNVNPKERNSPCAKAILRDMVIDDESGEKQEMATTEAPSSSRWKTAKRICFAVFPILVLAYCDMLIQMEKFARGDSGYIGIGIHVLMLSFMLGFHVWVVYKLGDIVFPRLQLQWKRLWGKR